MLNRLKTLLSKAKRAMAAATTGVESRVGAVIGAAAAPDPSGVYGDLDRALYGSKEIGGAGQDRVYIANKYTVHIVCDRDGWDLWRKRTPAADLAEHIRKVQESCDPPMLTYYELGVRLKREDEPAGGKTIWIEAEKRPTRIPTRCTPVAALQVVDGRQKGQSFLVTAGGRIGRFEDEAEQTDDIILTDASVSDVHAEFLVEHGQLKIRDLGSTNGTTVDAAPVRSEPMALGIGGILKIGSVVLRCDRPRAFAPYLLVVRGPLSLQGQSTRLDPSGERLTIGRTADAAPADFFNLHPDPATAPAHAEVWVNGEAACVRDISGAAWGRPLMVDSKPVGSGQKVLTEGDILQVGDVKLLYRES